MTTTTPSRRAAPGDTVVRTDRLTKRYGDRAAVDGVTMEVRRGEVYGFLGPNGAGKTTTLRMLLGLVRPTSGRAEVRSTRTGALVEGPGFYPYLSGRDNLRVMARHAGLDDRSVDHVLDRVDLAARGGDPFRSYSLGMKQRLGVACALLGEPGLLVLDEPANGLDPAGMADMRDLVRTIADAGQTVLLSSHLLTEVQEVCDRVGVISQGRLLAENTVSAIRGGSVVRVRAHPLDRALAVALQVLGDDVQVVPDPERRGGELRCPGHADDVPRLTRALVGADVDVLAISTVERSLEEVFFELTGQTGEEHLAVTR